MSRNRSETDSIDSDDFDLVCRVLAQIYIAQFGIDQAKVSKLLAGQMAGFSVERLVHFLSRLGQDVEVTVKKAPRGQRFGTVRAKRRGRSSSIAPS